MTRDDLMRIVIIPVDPRVLLCLPQNEHFSDFKSNKMY